MTRNEVLFSMNNNHPAGDLLVEVSGEELTRVFGGGDVQPDTTIGTVTIPIGITVGIYYSYFLCK
ncbi:mersacidin family lantibiotic [Neobacillus mesonae]|uniref:mersacidin family lantibiotic n=1 Tax=Neobacillus mesonae TaxID=1193713 RepID=UPI002E2253AC|nr:mersacidin family lantibiotic [Neobacillus mesonae]MED4206662.1 mersacidin family lantibiotic [Neobacillus mesonae]